MERLFEDDFLAWLSSQARRRRRFILSDLRLENDIPQPFPPFRKVDLQKSKGVHCLHGLQGIEKKYLYYGIIG